MSARDNHVHADWRYTDGSQRNCPQCRALASKVRANLKAKHKANPRDNLKHGEYSTYQNHGCRCGPCKTANAEYRAGRRRQGKS